MPQSVQSSGSGSSNQHRYVHVLLLNRETLVVPIESKNTKVQDILNRACEHVELRETDVFGLAQLRDNEFQFLQRDMKISKLASKVWKSKECSSEEPLQTFYLRVQYYVDNIYLLRDKATRLQYYLQLRDNLLNYHQAVSEEKCFLLASYALQADYGTYNASSHGQSYFDPREYFPASIVMRRGQDYITTHLPEMHKSMAGTLPTEARVNYIVELSTPPIAHNFHFYKMRKRKYDTTAVVWIALYPKALGIYEEADKFRCLMSVLLWSDIGKLHYEKKKFEVICEGSGGHKYIFFTDTKEWAEYIVDQCRQVHQFHLKMQSFLAELHQLDMQDQRYRERYVYCENDEFTMNRQQSFGKQIGTMDERSLATVHERPVECPSSLTAAASGIAVDLQGKNSAELEDRGHSEEEIFITTPPRLISNSSLIQELPHLLQSYGNSSERHQKRHDAECGLPRMLPDVLYLRNDGDNKDRCRIFDGNSRGVDSMYVPASSSESLSMPLFMRGDGIHQCQLQSLPSSSLSSNTSSLAPSAVTTPSQCSGSPGSSSACSGQLPLSLPTSRDVYDAAFLRQSLPLGVHFNEFLQNVWSGREIASDSSSAPRKSSLDHLQLYHHKFTEPVQRSTSLRQPLVGRSESGKSGKPSLALSTKTSRGLSIVRSNSDKTEKTSGLTLFSVNRPAVARSESGQRTQATALTGDPIASVTRSESNKSQKTSFALSSGQPSVTRSDSNRSQRLAYVVAPGPASVTRSDSNKSQNSAFAFLPQQMTILNDSQASITRTESNKSQKTVYLLPSEVSTQGEMLAEGYSVIIRNDDIPCSSGATYPIMPVEAQIQKLVFGPTMTAVSTPVRPTSERSVGNLSTTSYLPTHVYIPESSPGSVIRPSAHQAGNLSSPYQDHVAAVVPSEELYQSSGLMSSEMSQAFPLLSAEFFHPQSYNIPVEEMVESPEYCERGSPPPYGAFHSTISGIPCNTGTRGMMQSQQLSEPQFQHLSAGQPCQATEVHPSHLPTASAGVAGGKSDGASWLLPNGNGNSWHQAQTGTLPMGSMNDSQQQGVRETGLLPDSETTRMHVRGQVGVVRAHTSTYPEQNYHKERKAEVTRHVSDRYPGYRDPQCPRHGSGSDIREKLRSLGSSVPPMLNALLTDKSLHNARCTCFDGHGERRVVSSSHSSDSLNFSYTTSKQPGWNQDVNHKLRYFPDLSLDSDATMIINRTMTLNKTLDLEKDSEHYHGLAKSVGSTGTVGATGCSLAASGARSDEVVTGMGYAGSALLDRASDLDDRPLRVGQMFPNHVQSNSDSAAQQNVVFSEC